VEIKWAKVGRGLNENTEFFLGFFFFFCSCLAKQLTMKQNKIATIALIAIISYPSIDGFLISHDPTLTRSRFALYSSFGTPRDYFGEPGSSFMLKEFRCVP
jgi:hypothetical protein